MKCPKCGSEKTTLIQDKRGIPEAHCAECSAYIKKMSTGEVISYFSEKLSGNLDSKSEDREPDKESGRKTPDRGPCKFCTENYFTRRGRLGTIYYPVEAKFCPICGRELKESDRNYN